jgi:hypothetical protein
MRISTLSCRAMLGTTLALTALVGAGLAQIDELGDIPNVERLTEQECATYRRRLQDASSYQERAQIREKARIRAQQRVQPRQGGGGQDGGQGGGGQAPRRIPGGGGGRSN